MPDFARENLQRLMAAEGLSIARVSEITGVDQRTVRGLLRGRKRPHARTLHRLAEGLKVKIEEFFVDPAQLLYRRFDRHTNPMVETVLEDRPELFDGWTEADFDELHSRMGAGGPLTRQGALESVELMNRKRQLHDKFDLLLESSHSKLIGQIVELLHEQVVVRRKE
jgi:transcriptional regulator with XRE-family HTH domain